MRFLVVLAVLCLPTLAVAQGTTEMGDAFTKYGGGMINMFDVSNRAAPRMAGPADGYSKALNKFLTDYNATKSAMQGTALGLRVSTQFAVDGLTATLLVSGVGVVPALVVKGAGQIAVDQYMKEIDAQARAGVVTFLQQHKDELVKSLGADQTSISKMTNAELAAKVSQTTRVFADLEKSAPDDEDVRSFAKDLTITVLKETSIASLQLAQGNADQLMKVSKSFVAFKKDTVKALEEHEKVLAQVSTAVDDLSTAVQSIDKRLTSLGRDQAIVGDFVFSQMPAEQKAAALRSGFMKEKFDCPPAVTECDAKQIKEDLLKRFDSEARLQKLAGYAAKTAQALSDLSTIATNLNLGGDFAKGAELGSIAASAASAAMNGNYLGAIASVTGLFASRQSPEEARFGALMGYLQEQFKVINEKLDTILKNQQKIYEAVVGLSSQLTEVYKALEERLANIDFNVRKIAFAIGIERWDEWASCHALYQFVTEKNSANHYLDKLDFNKYNDMLRIASVKEQAILDCLRVAQAKPTSLLDPKWFGNFLDARLAVEFSPDELPPSLSKNEYFTKDLLRQYIEDYFGPLQTIVSEYSMRQGLTAAQLATLLILPESTLANFPTRLGAVKASDVCKDIAYASSGRGLRVICQRGNVDDLARRLVQTPMVLDGAVNIASWLFAVSRFADLRDPTKGAFLTATEFLERASTDQVQSGGYQIALDTLLVVDAGIAGASLLYGDLTAYAFLDVLTKPKEGDLGKDNDRQKKVLTATKILESNKILAQNVALALLRQRYTERKGLSLPPIERSGAIYRTATEDGLKDQRRGRPGELLNGIFGDDLQFRVNQKEKILELRLDTLGSNGKENLQALWVRIPAPFAFETGRLYLSNRLMDLLRLRDALVERLIDYDISRSQTKDNANKISVLISRSPEAAKREGVK